MRKILFVFILVFVAGLAFGQTILGQMFKLGGSTTALLPTSSTTLTGALIFDTDAGVIRYNDGTAWQTPPVEAFFSASLAPGGTGAAATTMLRHRMTRPGRASRLSYTTTAAGTGAGSFTLELYDVTTTTVLCTRTLGSCTTAGTYSTGSCSNAVWAAFDDIELRVDTSGCTTNPGVSAAIGIVGP